MIGPGEVRPAGGGPCGDGDLPERGDVSADELKVAEGAIGSGVGGIDLAGGRASTTATALTGG